MPRTARTARAATLATALLALAGCAGMAEPEQPGVIVHKEYIPASIKQIADVCNGYACSGGGEILERQCWRIDVEKVKPGTGGASYTRHYCVFPSEFKTLKVGDKYIAPKIAY